MAVRWQPDPGCQLRADRYHNAPWRFEAGTGSIADAAGLGTAIDYISAIGLDAIGAYEHSLRVYATRCLESMPGLRLIGTAPDKAAVLSFVIDGSKTEDIGAALAREGIAVRAGHHCAQPILRGFGLEATVRPSLAFYNTIAEVDALTLALRRLIGGRRPPHRVFGPGCRDDGGGMRRAPRKVD